MARNAMNVAKGIGAVVATVAVAGYVGNKVMHKNPRKVKRKANQAVRSMGDIANVVSYMLK